MADVGTPVSGTDTATGSEFFEGLVERANQAFDEPETSEVSTEAITPTQESPPETATPEKAVDRGDGRDQYGRFVPKGQAAESTQDAPAKAGEAQETAQTPTGEAQAPEASPPGEPAVAPAQETQPTAQPYAVRYNGQDFEVPGAVLTETHLVIPRETVGDVTKYIGMGIKYEHQGEVLKRDKTELQIQKEMFQAETGPVFEEIKKLFDIASIQDNEQFVNALVEYGAQLRQELPLLRERVQLAKERQEIAVQRRMQQPDPEVQQQQIAHQVVFTASQHLERYKQFPQAKPLTEADWQWVRERVQEDPDLYSYRVGQQLTERDRMMGAEQPGEVLFNEERLQRLVSHRLQYRNDLVAAEKNAKQAVEAAKVNAERRKAQEAPPPPAVSPAGSAAVPEVGETSQPRSMDELRKKLGVAF